MVKHHKAKLAMETSGNQWKKGMLDYSKAVKTPGMTKPWSKTTIKAPLQQLNLFPMAQLRPHPTKPKNSSFPRLRRVQMEAA